MSERVFFGENHKKKGHGLFGGKENAHNDVFNILSGVESRPV